MAPPRPRPIGDDGQSETSSSLHTTKERQTTTNATITGLAKSKRTLNHSNSTLNTKQTLATNGTPSNGTGDGASTDLDIPRISWASFDLPLLHSYRHTYHLSTPSAYGNPHAHHILSHGIGARSPSSIAAKRAARTARHNNRINGTTNGTGTSQSTNGVLSAKEKRNIGPITKDQLANNVRKHFNNLAVSEAEVLAKFRYVVRMGGLPETSYQNRDGQGRFGIPVGSEERAFRLRFHP